MIDRDKLLSIIENAFAELNELRAQDAQLVFSPDAPLYGVNSAIDSVDLVNFLLSVEEQLEDELDITFVIANEKALSLKNSPFKTMATLCDYLELSLSK